MGSMALEKIDVATLAAMRQADPGTRVLDVRTGGEFEAAHIPGSYNVPLDTLVEHLDEFGRLEHSIVLVCQSGGRAGQASAALSSAGKSSLHVLDGGLGGPEAHHRVLHRGEVVAEELHQRVPFFAGSPENVREVETFIARCDRQ